MGAGRVQISLIREITIRFSPDLAARLSVGKNQFNTIRKMLVKAEHGVSFSSIPSCVYTLIDTIAKEEKGFEQFLRLLKLLHQLSVAENISQPVVLSPMLKEMRKATEVCK